MDFLEGYKALFLNELVHRDLKLENILMHNDQIKIADFGFSKSIDN